MNKHAADHSVMAMVTQETLCSMKYANGDWQPDWETEIVESVEVDKDTLFCETCNEKIEGGN
jgi:hypothetical protein